MNQTTNQPCYSNNSIYSLAALSKCLGFEELFLTELAVIASSKYRLAKPITKPDGSIRQPFDAEEPLKEVHRRIKKEIFSKVVFPNYLTGSIKGCDYKLNASLHTDAKIVICEDVEGFFPATTTTQVFDIWRNFFGFSEDVANLLTALTTKDGALPQGAITSSYLANLTFWRLEPDIYIRLEQRVNAGLIEPSIAKLLNSVSGQVGKLSRFHPKEGNKLRLRIKLIRQKLEP
jgi:hypothetical protein